MTTKQHIVATIGYESADIADFLATLRAAGVKRVIDVRQLPMSRRRGFSKSALSAALVETGIEYIHIKSLGDPKAGREAARAGDFALFRRVFAKHMRSEEAQAGLQSAVGFAIQGGACLMCYERDHSTCHRSIIAQAMSAITPITIRNLGVRDGLAGYRTGVEIPATSQKRP